MSRLMKELENYRLARKLTQKALAKELGVTFLTVNRWLNGHHKPSKIQEYQIKELLKKVKK